MTVNHGADEPSLCLHDVSMHRCLLFSEIDYIVVPINYTACIVWCQEILCLWYIVPVDGNGYGSHWCTASKYRVIMFLTLNVRVNLILGTSLTEYQISLVIFHF